MSQKFRFAAFQADSFEWRLEELVGFWGLLEYGMRFIG